MNPIVQWVLRTMMKGQTGVVKTLPNKKLLDINVNMTIERLIQNRIDPSTIKTPDQLDNIIKQIETPKNVQQGIKSTKSAKVFDLKGKEIDPKKGIMGGKQIDDDLPPPGSRGGPDDIAAPIQSAEDTLKNIIEAENKEAIKKLKAKKDKKRLEDRALEDFVDDAGGVNPDDPRGIDDFIPEDDPEPLAKGGRAGFKIGTGNLLLKLTRGFMQATGRKPKEDEILKIIQETAERRIKNMQSGLSDDFILSRGDSSINAVGREMRDIIKNEKPEMLKLIDELDKPFVDDEGRFFNSKGGRIGLKTGMTKRAFLKLMGGVGAGIAGLKSGLLGIGKGAATKQVAKEAVEQGMRSTPPPYFFELANKIKTLGKPDKVTYADRVEIHRYTGKNGDEYELIEDLNTGDMRIQKDKIGGANFGDKSYEVIDDRTVLEYRKGEVNVKDEGLETQSSFKAADEYEEYKVEFDQDGTEAGADEIAANVQKEIVEEAGGEAPSIKKASGGIARMLGE